MTNNIIPIFFACDDNFVKYTIVALHSIMKNADRTRKSGTKIALDYAIKQGKRIKRV